MPLLPLSPVGLSLCVLVCVCMHMHVRVCLCAWVWVCESTCVCDDISVVVCEWVFHIRSMWRHNYSCALACLCMISGLTVNVYIYNGPFRVSPIKLAQAGVTARVPQRGFLDDQLGGHLIQLEHLGLIFEFLVVLQPWDRSLFTGWRGENKCTGKSTWVTPARKYRSQWSLGLCQFSQRYSTLLKF